MKFNLKSIGFKLWLSFILFAAVILTLLWLLQIVFLQSFYEAMKIRDVEQISNTLTEAYSNPDFETTLDEITFRNSILVYVTDMNGAVIYSSDEHGSGGPQEKINGGNVPGGFARPLPASFADFLNMLNNSKDGNLRYTISDPRSQGKVLIYGVILPDAVLYISTPLEPVNATTDILRTQLVYVTIVALLLSLIVAVFIARKFSKPVTNITKKAGRLTGGDFKVTFDKGFCSELDELAITLDHTAKELSKVEKLRRELIANISHDLRTPLTMVKAYTEMIHDISGDDKEKREAHLAIISNETERLIALVNDILELSAIQSENVEPKFDNICLSDVANTIISRFTPLAEHEGYTIKSTVEPDQYVLADERKLTQVLYNLIGNAINYIGEDRAIEIHLSDLGARVRFEVTDHGEGMSEDELPLIWDRYYKSKDHKRGKVGTGLGLSIVKGILELHKARFGAESRIGRGSTFWFELNK